MQAELRMPAVAGRFYPGTQAALERDLGRCFGTALGRAPRERAIAVLSPHAGWVYSGAIAAETFARILPPRTALILCPNHTGLGSRRSVWDAGAWRLPGGDVPVDEPLARALVASAGLESDRAAHLREHAIEVQLPFLRRLNAELRIVPICLGRLSLDECLRTGESIATALLAGSSAETTTIVASSDMSHYLPAETARVLDARALWRVIALDPEGLYRTVVEHDISMCGFIPTTVALAAARRLGAKRAELVRYGNSGDTSGDFESVVGYAGAVIA
jgi:hypothetical protein